MTRKDLTFVLNSEAQITHSYNTPIVKGHRSSIGERSPNYIRVTERIYANFVYKIQSVVGITMQSRATQHGQGNYTYVSSCQEIKL